MSMSAEVQTCAPPAVPAAEPAAGEPTVPETVLEAPRGWQLVDVRELWRYRELVFFLCWRDVKVRYKQTALGAAWAVLQPAMLMVVFTVFFNRLAGISAGDTPYPLFALAGLLPWTFFATAITAAGNSVVASERLITKVYFPRLAVPFAAVGASAVDFAVAFGLLAALMAFYGHAPGANLWLVPVVFAAITMTALGVGTLLAALNVAYRDVRYVIPFFVQVGMFATPTIYMLLPPAGDGGWQPLLALNPMTTLIAAFRACVLGGEVPWAGLAAASAGGLVCLVVGCLYFRKVEDDFADVI
jgi:lipopolysaccharide transport system permease protein